MSRSAVPASPVPGPTHRSSARPRLGANTRRRSRPRPSPAPAAPRRASHVAVQPISRYLDAHGRARELVALPARHGSVLVLDRDATTLGDRRLLAHLAADEPPENAALVCRLYLEDDADHACRRVLPSDLEGAPFAAPEPKPPAHGSPPELEVRAGGQVYRLGTVLDRGATPQLRWSRRHDRAAAGRLSRAVRASSSNPELDWDQVKLRDVVGALESYEPVRALTEQSLMRHSDDPAVLCTRLRDEFERLCTSPIVLNRSLREAVLAAVRRGASMSEIALRCGVVKRHRRGTHSGETSWLARRVGLMPEGGAQSPTPWIHSDVLAVIARRGLGLSPREVELQ